LINFLIKNKIGTVLSLIIFHALISILLFNLANSDFFIGLHNGSGLWNFSRDSQTYQAEAIKSLSLLNNSFWIEWWNSFPNHKHVKLISLLYFLTDSTAPLIFEIVNGPIWVVSVILIYKSSRLIFSESIKSSLLVCLFLFQPSVLLSSTQLLREPIYILGFCLFCYGVVRFWKLSSDLKSVFIVSAGLFLLISMRDYLSSVYLITIMLFAFTLLIFKKKSYFSLILLIFPLLLFEIITTNKYLSGPDKMSSYTQNKLLTETVNNENLDDWVKGTTNEFEEKLYQSTETDISKKDIVNEILSELEISTGDMSSADILKRVISEVEASGVNIIESDILKIIISDSVISESDIVKKIISDLDISEVDISVEDFVNEIHSEEEVDISEVAVFIPEVIPKKSDSFVSKKIQSLVTSISTRRWGFYSVNENQGSAIDITQLYGGIGDIFIYFPRAFQIALFSPFPSSWLKEGKQVGFIGNILAGIEMIIFYIVLIGLIYIIFKKPLSVAPLWPVFFVSILIIFLIVYVVPNLGAVYRMRQPYLIPFYIIGVNGICLLISSYNYKKTV